MPADNHKCLHEDQLSGQSRAIERLSAELDYKKERLDDLKEDNRRMEKKIDDIGTDLTNFINTSNSNDGVLDNRIVRIETRLDENEKATKDNRAEFNKKISVGGFVLAVLMFILTFYRG